MAYPPKWRIAADTESAIALMEGNPFAQLFTGHNGLRTTRIPLIADRIDGRPSRLRGHMNARNPQAERLDGAEALAVFSGAHCYVSPHWRREPTRGGTVDYEEVRVRGTVRVQRDETFFRTLIDDLSMLIEPRYAEAGDYPVWQTAMAPDGYIERLLPHLTAFIVEIAEVEMISKLHQSFPADDRRSVADHLERLDSVDACRLARKIREQLD